MYLLLLLTKITNAAIKETTRLRLHRSTPLTFWSHPADYPGIHLFHKHYIYPLMPSPAHLLPLTGSACRAVHRELGFNSWKNTGVPISACQFTTRPLVAEITTKPQLVKHSSERVLTNAVAEAMDVHIDHTGCSFRIIKTNCTAIVSMVRSEAGSNMIMLLV